jgi:hypothetical protein
MIRGRRPRGEPVQVRSSTQNVLRIAFAWGITAIVAISAYFGMLWLFGAR